MYAEKWIPLWWHTTWGVIVYCPVTWRHQYRIRVVSTPRSTDQWPSMDNCTGYSAHTHARTHIHTRAHNYTHVHTHTYTYTQLHANTNTWPTLRSMTNTYWQTPMYDKHIRRKCTAYSVRRTHIYSPTQLTEYTIHKYTHTPTHMQTYTQTYIHTYTYIRTYIHTYTLPDMHT